MKYVNRPFEGKDIPSSDEIKDAFERFISIDTGAEWYNMDYIKNETPKQFIANAKMNLEMAGYDVNDVFLNQRGLLEHLKSNLDRVDFFRSILLNFYMFTECVMEIFTIDVRHARTLSALYKWQAGETIEVTVNSFFTLDDKTYFFVVENKANGPRDDEDCKYLYTVYKSVENVLQRALSDEFDFRVDHLTNFMSSTTPKRPWSRDDIANMIQMRIDHVARCIEYTGDKRIISTQLKVVMNRLRLVIDRIDRIMGVFT